MRKILVGIAGILLAGGVASALGAIWVRLPEPTPDHPFNVPNDVANAAPIAADPYRNDAVEPGILQCVVLAPDVYRCLDDVGPDKAGAQRWVEVELTRYPGDDAIVVSSVTVRASNEVNPTR